MANIRISKDEIINTARIFKHAGEETEEIIKRLETQMTRLKNTWQDANGEVFFQFYEEWSKHIGGFAEALYVISKELDSISEYNSSLES
jgi:WXG100 family type VII secretion target